MPQNMLKLNNVKTEVIRFTLKHNSQFMDEVSVQVITLMNHYSLPVQVVTGLKQSWLG